MAWDLIARATDQTYLDIRLIWPASSTNRIDNSNWPFLFNSWPQFGMAMHSNRSQLMHYYYFKNILFLLLTKLGSCLCLCLCLLVFVVLLFNTIVSIATSQFIHWLTRISQIKNWYTCRNYLFMSNCTNCHILQAYRACRQYYCQCYLLASDSSVLFLFSPPNQVSQPTT